MGMISQNCQAAEAHCDTAGCLHTLISLFAHGAASHLHSQLCPAEETGQRNVLFLSVSVHFFRVFLEPSDWSTSPRVVPSA